MGRNVCSLSMTGMQALCQCKRSLLIAAYVREFVYYVHFLYLNISFLFFFFFFFCNFVLPFLLQLCIFSKI
jgi:hypothetical protein